MLKELKHYSFQICTYCLLSLLGFLEIMLQLLNWQLSLKFSQVCLPMLPTVWHATVVEECFEV